MSQKADSTDQSFVLQTSEVQVESVQQDDGVDENQIKAGNAAGDSMSILRFVRGNKSKRLEISPSGLTLKYHKASSQKGEKQHPQPEGDELVLTNMAFYIGLHLWEIIAPISCNSIQIGVYNPVTKTEILTSFKTTTPRTVTVCLDLNENMVKFWLNDRRNSGKNLKLTEGGPWIPCVKISTEKNKLILNPFAKEPSDFYEKDFDKRFTLKKFLMPHLHNMVCVTNLSKLGSIMEASQYLKEKFKLSANDISKILMPPFNSEEVSSLEAGYSSKDNFFFLQFHFHDTMAEFIQKNSSADHKIYQSYQIAEWYEKPDLANELKEPYQFIQSHITIPKAALQETLKSMSDSYTKLIVEKQFASVPEAEPWKAGVLHPFTGKILLQNENILQILSKDPQSSVFNRSICNLSLGPSSLTQNIELKIENKLLKTLFCKINWSSLFKEGNEMINSFVKTFFESLSSSGTLMTESSDECLVAFIAQFNVAKFFVDICIQHVKSHLDRLKRHYQSCTSLIPITNSIVSSRIKAEVALESVHSLPFFEDPNFSVDDIYLTLNILYGLSEQIWAKAKDKYCPQDVKSFVNSVSRPFSAFNRLGSFVSFGSTKGDSTAALLAEQGFFMRENMTVSLYDNMATEIQDVSEDALLNESYLKEQLGTGNRFLNSLVCDNVPLYKTLNYFSSRVVGNTSTGKFLDVIASQNSDFFLIGLANGSLNICSSTLTFPSLRRLNMFDNDRSAKIKKHKKVMEKVHQRMSNFEDYRKQTLRKGASLSILQDQKKREWKHSQEETNESKQNKKVFPDFVKNPDNAIESAKVMHDFVKQAALKGKQYQSKVKKQNKGLSKKVPSKKKEAKSSKEQSLKTIPENFDPDYEGLIIPELFGEVAPTSIEKTSSISKKITSLRPFLQAECKVFGYILISKPASMNVIDPLIVGCVFFNEKVNKFFLRVKKLTFTVQYLQNFITLDPQTGHTINKISGKQLINSDDIKSMNKEILNHKETIVDLYTVFMRSQVIKKDWPKKDHKFFILDDLSDAEIEIEDCIKVIDFTRCAYAISATQQSVVHIVIETSNAKAQLIQFSIMDDAANYDEQTQLMPIKIDRGKEMDLDSVPLKVFQYDDKVLLVGSESYQILRQDNFQVLEDIKLDSEFTIHQTASIANMTSPSQIYSKQNILRQGTEVEQQEWNLVIGETTDNQRQYRLVENVSGLKKQKSERVGSEIDLSSASISDIIQIGNLLESKNEGSQAVENKFSVLTSSGVDQDNSLPIHHHWQLLEKTEQEYQLECKLNSKEKEVHLKQIDLEFSFQRKVSNQMSVKFAGSNIQLQKSIKDTSQAVVQRLPLIVEQFTGAQINDQMHPNILVSPDSYVFCSNYPQPEFIFRLQSNKLFVPSEFVVKSRENRIFNGIPISSGLIFASDNLEDLMNTKQFSKLNNKELLKWFDLRFNSGQFKDQSSLPTEPIAYFNMEDKTEITIDVSKIQRHVKYIKFIPTAFRKAPINFSSKPFHSNQAECQFFGVNGYETELIRSVGDDYETSSPYLQEQISVDVNAELREASGFIIGQIDKLNIVELRSAKSQQSSVPITYLQSLTLLNIIGVCRTQISIKEEQSDCVHSLVMSLKPKQSESEWELVGVSMSVKSYTDSSANFSSPNLQENKPKLRHFLLDITQFPNLLGKLLDIAQDAQQSDERRGASLQCIMNFLKNNSQDKQYSTFLSLLNSKTYIKSLLSSSYLDQSVSYQNITQQYLDKVGLLKSEYISEVFLKSQIAILLDQARPIQKVKQIFEMLSLCPAEKVLEIQSSLVNTLFKRICEDLLPQYQTQDYIMLRSKLGLNLFPYDDITFKSTDAVSTNSSIGLLSCNMEMSKLNTLYQYTVDFGAIAMVDHLKLYFEEDDKSNYKILIRIIAPIGNDGKEEIIYRRSYDENTFSQVCEQAFKSEVSNYFNQESNGNAKQSKPYSDLNSLTIELPNSYTGRYLRVQIELTDTFKSVHKAQAVTTIFIRPEFHGRIVDTNSKVVEKFKVMEALPKCFVTKLEYNGVPYKVYNNADDLNVTHNKSCIIVVNEKEQIKHSVEDASCPKEEEYQAEKGKETLEEQRQKLKELITNTKQGVSKKVVRQKIGEINKIAQSVVPAQSQLSLRYLLGLADLIAANVLSAIKSNPELINTFDVKTQFSTLFQRFYVYDINEQHPNIGKLQEVLFNKIDDKSQFICSLIQQYLFPNATAAQFSQKNVINFIQQQKDIDFNQLLQAFSESFNLSSIKTLQSLENIGEIIETIGKNVIKDDYPVQSIIAVLTIIDELGSEAKNSTKLVSLDLMLKLFTSFAINCPPVKDNSHKNRTVAFKYMLHIFLQFLSSKSSGTELGKELLLKECQNELATLIFLSVIRNDKEFDKMIKDILIALSVGDTNKSTTKLLGQILEWYKCKDNITHTSYYQSLEQEQSGKGSGIFYKHMSQFFELYMELLSKNQSSGDDSIKDAYKDLGTLVNELLEVLVNEQDSENYEENFLDVWVQILKTVTYLVEHKLVDQSITDLFTSQFFKLKPIFQESLYPEFHLTIQKSIDPKNPQIIISLLNSFFRIGLADNNSQKLKMTYCFGDGLLNIFSSLVREKSSPILFSCTFKDAQQAQELSTLFIDYLMSHINNGVFYGVTGANTEIVMKLEIAVQISNILINGKIHGGANAFEEFVKAPSQDNIKQKFFQDMVQWIIFNYNGNKSKTSPSGSRIFTLCSNVELLLGKVSVCEQAVSLCLPILMKTILQVDFKLRELILNSNEGKNQINFEKGVQIQKTVNTLFLAFFKQWVQTDAVAKKFLTELNGFDFLLDRLFTKDQSIDVPQEAQQQKQIAMPSTTLEVSEYLFGEDENCDDDQLEEDQLMSIALAKMAQLKLPLQQQTSKSLAPLSKKKSKQAKPSVPKQETVVVKASEEKSSEVDALKDVESKLSIDDWAKNLKLIWSSDKESQVKLQYGTLQWNKFKNGAKNRLYNYQITDPAFSYEYVLKFDLESLIMLNEVQIGVVYNWSTYDPDCNYEPVTLILEGGREENQKDWSVILTPIQDNGFNMNSITVYGYSFTDSSNIKETSLERYLEKIGSKEARYLTLRFRKPMMACTEQSLYISQVAKIKSYGLSFVSCMGTQVPKPSNVFSYLMDIQKENSLEVLSKFFSNEFTEAFEMISEQESIIEKIKNAFDKLSVLMNTKASLIKPIFLAICSKNQTLGDWIMNNRLISMDPLSIKKEQISFLGDIISSNKEKQHDKLVTLKSFIIEQINSVADGKLTMTDDQVILLQRYLKLFIKKLRDFAFQSQSSSEIELKFQAQDLDNVVALMSKCSDPSKNKFFNALTEFALILLLPPRPLANKTIRINDYIEKLLTSEQEHKLQNLLFCSIMASTDSKAIENILRLGKIEWLIETLQDSKLVEEADLFQYAQILFNCSKQETFKFKYRSTLPIMLYNYIKQETDTKLLRPGVSDTTLSLLVHTIRDVILGGDAELEAFSILLKDDINKASDKGDVDFINGVIVPILHAEEKVPVTISIKSGSSSLQPIFEASESGQTQRDNFFLKTSILNKKQKATFGKMFKEMTHDKVENSQKLHEGKWDIIFEDKAHQNQNPAKFKQFVKAVSNRSNVIIFIQCKVQEQQVVFGGFTNKPFPSLGETWAHEFDYQIPFSEANFVCYYTPDKELHFNMTHNKAFGYIYTDYEEGGALSISGDFFLISWSYEFQNSCGNIYDMKCVEEQAPMSFYNNMEISHIEVWSCDTGSKQTISNGKVKSDLKKNTLYNEISPFNFFRQNLVFEVSKTMTLSQLAKEIFGKNEVFISYPTEDIIDGAKTISDILLQGQCVDAILDLVIKQSEIKKEEPLPLIKPVEAAVTEEVVSSRERVQPLLKKFEEKGGIFDIIKAAKAAVKLYPSEKLREIWSLWLNEIESFSQLPSFFSTFCQDGDKEAVLYLLIEGKQDYPDATMDPTSPEALKLIKEQEELHLEMVKQSYMIVSKVFENHESAELRDNCLKNGTFERFVERIGQLSSEKKRQKVERVEQIAIEPEIQMVKKGDKVKTMKKKKKEDKKDQKRKGVGYTTGVGTAWNVSEYLKSKEAKSQQAANVVNILKHMIKSKDWVAPPEIKNILLESALLPTLEAAFRSGSLLEMAKEYDLNIAYLGFVQELAHHPTLIELLLDIGDEYEPRQKEPLYKLLQRLNDLSTIFLGCLSVESKTTLDEEQIKPRNLAEKISETNKIVQEKITQQSHNIAQQSLNDIMSLPLSEAYWQLLSPKRFDQMDMKTSSGTYNHVFQQDMHKAVNPPVSKLVRLAQEIADLSNSLPCDYTNAIFCRVDKERVDVMKCIIMGASGTPYAHGAFVYDLLFENSYPNSPPKCQLVTTGGQTVRFNPNLYNNGKVCLSLLGTWRGQSTENWDPKLSTILQVLLSIQAIIMSNEVYFNEPGYEHEAGTIEGERKNEGYANIVRYCNVKFAIVDAIKNPPPGFEKIIRSSFYLKKNEVLREVKEWVDKAKTSDANYTGLVYDHNYHWAPQISPEGKYAEMMEAVYNELKETLDALPSPFEDQVTGLKVERKFSHHEDDAKGSKETGTISKIEDVDVSYEPMTNEQQSININDDKVKDRWSRYIGAMGIEAVAKQAESRILISGLGPLGVEIAKNIVLAGCKELILFDDVNPTSDELSGQFFIQESDVKASDFTKTRANYSKDKLQQLNFYVKVSVLDQYTVLNDYISGQPDIKVVILTDFFQFTTEQLYQINTTCRAKKIPMINAYQNGMCGKVFNDFGAEFVVLDKDGEDLQEVMIKDISFNEEKQASVVTLLQGFKHKYEDGDQIIIREALGMTRGDESINNKTFTIKVINPESFTINEDVRTFTPYEGNGIAKQVKVPRTLTFKSLEESESDEKAGGAPLFDQNLFISDFEKIENKQFIHYIYKGLALMIQDDDYTEDQPFKFCESILAKVKNLIPKDLQSEEKQQKKLAQLTYMVGLTCRYSFPPIAAFLGGVVAQEIIKAITQKYTPINQHFYFDCTELYQEQDILSLTEEERKDLVPEPEESSDRYMGLKACIGDDLFDCIRDCHVFMIGAGAIGCELLKNYAMLGLGTGSDGKIIVTDPDVIEVSNLNRQFLFREKHLRKPKSSTAAAAAIQMNPHLKNHISARLDKIHDGTAHIYNESFFTEQTIVTNALDNVQARLYLDSKCVAARVPMIDSGTLGSKGHVQIVLPDHKTESYASQRDPDDNTGEIPHCTLKMFPEETLHCVEWAKDLFGNLYSLQPQSFNKLVIEERDKAINFSDQQEKAALKKVIKQVEKKPTSFEDCLRYARLRFQKHFVNDVKQLLHVYPLDKLTKEGRPFWSLPKRPPHPVEFDPENLSHTSVIAAYACLRANMYGIKIPYEQPRSTESKLKMAESVAKIEVPAFVPNDQKASSIESQVDKESKKEEQEEEQTNQMQQIQKADDVDEIRGKYLDLIKPLQASQEMKLTVEEFEKDNDDNFHIDFIHALANIRAANYKLEPMDWITVKIKAGRIVPALATTTAAIAALQVIELLKYLKDVKLEEHRNSFLNLAVPSLMMSEPGPSEKTKLTDALEVTLWDRWEYEATSRETNLLELVEYLEETYKLEVRDIFYGSIPLYMHALQIGGDRKVTLSKQSLLEQTGNKDDAEFIDLIVTFADPTASDKVLEGVPPVRVILPPSTD